LRLTMSRACAHRMARRRIARTFCSVEVLSRWRWAASIRSTSLAFSCRRLFFPMSVELDMWALGLQRIQTPPAAPVKEGAQVGIAVYPGLALDAGEIGRNGQMQCVLDEAVKIDQLGSVHPPLRHRTTYAVNAA